MIVSHEKRFVMLLPWKTGSQTLIARLRSYNESAYHWFFHFEPHLNRVVHQHLTRSDFEALPESRLGYFLASFIRNPYDRAYSGFLELQRALRVEHAGLPIEEKWVRQLVMHQLDENRRQLEAAEGDFDRWLASVEDYQVFEAGRNTYFPLHPAHYWTHTTASRPWTSWAGSSRSNTTSGPSRT